MGRGTGYTNITEPNFSNQMEEQGNNKRTPYSGGKNRTHRKSFFLDTPRITKEQMVDVITPRRTTFKNIITGETKLVTGKSSKGETLKYGGFDRRGRYKGLETMTRNIQWYRQWFQWLKLSISLEGSKLLDKKVSIDRRFYSEWGIDDISEYYFDDWWKEHRELFQSPKVKLVKSFEENDSENFYVRIPKNRNPNEVVREIKELLQGKLQGNKPKYNFKENDTTPYIKLHQQWNIFILTRNGCSQKQIIEWLNDKYSHLVSKTTTEVINGKKVETLIPVISTPQSLSRSLRRSRERIHRVTKGVFP